jgi:hypothetical protein
MVTFNCTLEEFKQGVAEFCKAAPTCDEDSLENGFKAVGLMYLSVPTDDLTLQMAKGYLEFASKRYWERINVLNGLEILNA